MAEGGKKGEQRDSRPDGEDKNRLKAFDETKVPVVFIEVRLYFCYTKTVRYGLYIQCVNNKHFKNADTLVALAHFLFPHIPSSNRILLFSYVERLKRSRLFRLPSLVVPIIIFTQRLSRINEDKQNSTGRIHSRRHFLFNYIITPQSTPLHNTQFLPFFPFFLSFSVFFFCFIR